MTAIKKFPIGTKIKWVRTTIKSIGLGMVTNHCPNCGAECKNVVEVTKEDGSKTIVNIDFVLKPAA